MSRKPRNRLLLGLFHDRRKANEQGEDGSGDETGAAPEFGRRATLIRYGLLLMSVLLAVLAAFVSFCAKAFYTEAGWTVLTIQADYDFTGWMLRIAGAVLALIVLYVLIGLRDLVWNASLLGFLGKMAAMLCVVCLLLEIALPVLVIMFVVVGIYLAVLIGGSSGDGG